MGLALKNSIFHDYHQLHTPHFICTKGTSVIQEWSFLLFPDIVNNFVACKPIFLYCTTITIYNECLTKTLLINQTDLLLSETICSKACNAALHLLTMPIISKNQLMYYAHCWFYSPRTITNVFLFLVKRLYINLNTHI